MPVVAASLHIRRSGWGPRTRSASRRGATHPSVRAGAPSRARAPQRWLRTRAETRSPESGDSARASAGRERKAAARARAAWSGAVVSHRRVAPRARANAACHAASAAARRPRLAGWQHTPRARRSNLRRRGGGRRQRVGARNCTRVCAPAPCARSSARRLRRRVCVLPHAQDMKSPLGAAGKRQMRTCRSRRIGAEMARCGYAASYRGLPSRGPAPAIRSRRVIPQRPAAAEAWFNRARRNSRRHTHIAAGWRDDGWSDVDSTRRLE